MKANKTKTNILGKDVAGVLALTGSALLIPLVAMQFTHEVNWDISDFVIMGTLIFCIGMLVVLAARKIEKTNHKIGVIIALLIMFLFIWAQLAVGIIDIPFSGS